MRFENRTSGVFEVLVVHLDADQSFDAGRLRQETLRLVEKGSRRIVVDLGSIDYLYSDSINAFVALNRRLLESSGRLGILVPHPKVHEILVRAGLENIMRLYRTEAELLGDSRELMRQSSAWTRPVELLNAASASQILSSNNLLSRSVEAGRDAASSSQRIARRRTGPRVELKSRRHDGRRMDQPSEEMPLPPALPGVGSESATLRNLSLDSSTFGVQPLAKSEEWKPTPAGQETKPTPPTTPPTPHVPHVLPGAEPTVFQLPQDPEQDGYSTDAWLLALTSQPLPPELRADVEQDSSGFLPKLGTEESLVVAPLDDPPSQINTDLRWEEEISLTDGPKASTPVPQAPSAPSRTSTPQRPAPAEESPFSKAFLDSPPSRPAASGTTENASLGNEALRKAMFHETPTLPKPQQERPSPVAPPAPPAALQGQVTAEPTLVTPTVAPPRDAFLAAPHFPVPAAVSVESKAALPADDWFGSSKRSTPSVPRIPATPLPVPVKPAAVELSKVATPVDDWFGSAKRSVPTTPAPPPPPAPLASPPAAPPPAVAVPKPTALANEAKVKSPAENWFAQPAPRLMAPVRDRPSETDAWFGKQASTLPVAKPAVPALDPPLGAKPAPESKPDTPHVAADLSPTADEWFRKPAMPSMAPAAPYAPKPPSKKPDPSFLNSDDFGRPARKRRGIGFWIAVLVGGLLILGGVAVLVGGLANRRAADVPPVTAPASEIPSVPAPVSQNPSTPSLQPETIPAKVEAKDRTKSAPHKRGQPATSAAPSVPAPPPEEEHAPVKVFVTSRPSGARLSLDGKSVGTTPCEITVKRNGNLDFALAGYRTFHQVVDPDEIHGTLNVQLLSDGGGGSAGRIYISSSPSGADIQVAGKFLGKTPKLVDLPTGSQKITVKSGEQSQTKTLDIQSGTNPSENFSL